MESKALYPERLVVTVTQEIKDQIKEVANSIGLDVTSYLRMKMLEMISDYYEKSKKELQQTNN